MNWSNNRATTCVADVGITANINYSALYVIIPLDHIDVNKCQIKRKNIVRHETPAGSIVYAGWGKYKRGVPQRIATSRNFCNATSLSVSLGDGRYASVAVYCDKVHVCGCKDEPEIKQCMNYLLHRMYTIQELLEQVRKNKDILIQFFRDNFTGVKCTVTGVGEMHILKYEALALYQRYGRIAYILDPYLSAASYVEEAIFFLEWCCLIDDIITPCSITYIDYHNIHYDLHLGFNVDLVALAFLIQSKGYEVGYSNVNDSYVHVTIPYHELDESVTRRKKSRYVINIYRTGAVKMYGPSFKGIQKEFDKFYLFVKGSQGLLEA